MQQSADSMTKESARARRYYQANRENILERVKRRAEMNREEIAAYIHDYSKAYRVKPENRTKALLGAAAARAVKYDVPFSLSPEWVMERLRNGICELTGIAFNVATGGGRHPFSPSIDRIEPALGYVPGNSRLIICAANMGKNKWSDDVLLTWARALVARHPL